MVKIEGKIRLSSVVSQTSLGHLHLQTNDEEASKFVPDELSSVITTQPVSSEVANIANFAQPQHQVASGDDNSKQKKENLSHAKQPLMTTPLKNYSSFHTIVDMQEEMHILSNISDAFKDFFFFNYYLLISPISSTHTALKQRLKDVKALLDISTGSDLN